MCKLKEEAMERAGELPGVPQGDPAIMDYARLTTEALTASLRAAHGEIAALTAECAVLAEKVEVGAAVDSNVETLIDAVDGILEVLDAYPEQLVQINRQSATVSLLRAALKSAAPASAPAVNRNPYSDKSFLQWIHDRLAFVHSENKSFDYMHKLRAIIAATPDDRETVNIASAAPVAQPVRNHKTISIAELDDKIDHIRDLLVQPTVYRAAAKDGQCAINDALELLDNLRAVLCASWAAPVAQPSAQTTVPTDLSKRLRETAKTPAAKMYWYSQIMTQAADEIERLTASQEPSAQVRDADPEDSFDEFWSAEQKRNGYPIGADYRHWALVGFKAALAAAQLPAQGTVPVKYECRVVDADGGPNRTEWKEIPKARYEQFTADSTMGDEGTLIETRALYDRPASSSPAQQPTDSAAQSGVMLCPQCGVDRLKLPCPGMADECAMIADAHLAAQSGDEGVA